MLQIVGCLLVLWVVTIGTTFTVFLADLIVIYAIVAIAQDWLIGRTGQVSLGAAALMAIGAFTTATLLRDGVTNFLVVVLASMLAGAIVGLIIGLPALRLRGLYLLLSTLALQFLVAFGGEKYQDKVAPGGFPIAKADLFGVRFGSDRAAFIVLVISMLIIVGLLQNMYRRSPGRAWQAIRESEVAASVVGVNVFRWKMAAFIGSSAITSFAGCMYAYYSGLVSYDAYSLTLAISVIVMIFVGGTGTIAGPIIGAMFVGLTPYVLTQLGTNVFANLPAGTWFTNNQSVLDLGLYSVALLLVILYERNGLVVAGPRIARALRRLGRALATRRRGPAQPGTAPPSLGMGGDTSSRVAIGEARSSDLLVVENLRVTYSNGAVGSQRISLVVPTDKVVGIVGRNGAGKTTTLRAIAGFPFSEHVQVQGDISFDGHSMAGMGTRARGQRGIVLVPERDKICPSLTVAENLRLVGANKSRLQAAATRFPTVWEKAGSQAGLLSGGERQLLAMAMAWQRSPRLLMLDELSLGLAPVAMLAVVEQLETIRRDGTTVLLVDQDMSSVLGLCDYVYVLDHGDLVAEGPASEFREQTAAGYGLGETP